MKKVHELILLGGLGNQLFILFKAYRLSIINPTDKIILNYSPISLTVRKDRPLQVDRFIVRDNIILVDGDCAKIRYKLILVIFKLFNKIFLFNSFKINLFTYSISYSYYQKFIEDKISERILDILKPLFQSDRVNTLAIHIRRGDYLHKNHQFHGLVQVQPILNEVDYYLSKHIFDSLTIFTDSPEQIDMKQFSHFGIPVLLDSGGDSIEVFRRMCNSTGIIGANSTFSLWAIILGNPEISSIPYQWNKRQTSYHLGLKNIRRYK
jgi:hypothetical protein